MEKFFHDKNGGTEFAKELNSQGKVVEIAR